MLVVIFVVLAAYLLTKARRFRGDLPKSILESAVRVLPNDRRTWGQAMLAELESIEGRLARLRFALVSRSSLRRNPARRRDRATPPWR